MKKSNLDEMQEQKLMQIEHNGHWLAVISLLVSIAVQGVLGCDFFDILGELLILLVICIYVAIACIKNGIWDRHFHPDRKTNILFSLGASIFVGIFTYLRFVRFVKSYLYLLGGTLLAMLFVFVLCYTALSLMSKLYKNRRNQLEDE